MKINYLTLVIFVKSDLGGLGKVVAPPSVTLVGFNQGGTSFIDNMSILTDV